MTNDDRKPPTDGDQTSPYTVTPKRTFSRRILTAVGAIALTVGLLVGGGAGVALATTVLNSTSGDQSNFVDRGTPPDFGTRTPPDMGNAPGSATPPSTDEGTSTESDTPNGDSSSS